MVKDLSSTRPASVRLPQQKDCRSTCRSRSQQCGSGLGPRAPCVSGQTGQAMQCRLRWDITLHWPCCLQGCEVAKEKPRWRSRHGLDARTRHFVILPIPARDTYTHTTSHRRKAAHISGSLPATLPRQGCTNRSLGFNRSAVGRAPSSTALLLSWSWLSSSYISAHRDDDAGDVVLHLAQSAPSAVPSPNCGPFSEEQAR